MLLVRVRTRLTRWLLCFLPFLLGLFDGFKNIVLSVSFAS
jgi:hypothetical protein